MYKQEERIIHPLYILRIDHIAGQPPVLFMTSEDDTLICVAEVSQT